jgi:acetyl esterase
MPLHPKAKQMLDEMEAAGRPSSDQVPIEQARENLSSLFADLGPGPDVAEVRDLEIPTPEGGVRARLYRPAEGELPLTLSFHAGGWSMGDLDTHELVARGLALASGVAVLSVEYRLAPENKSPAALDDCFAALEWAYQNGAKLRIDPERIAVAGDSAGGNLAAGVAIRARDAGGPPIRFQLLIYPTVEVSGDDDWLDKRWDGAFLSQAELKRFAREYLVEPGQAKDPLVSPMYADLHGLPAACIVAAECDPTVVQSEAYAQALRQAGVPVEMVTYDGMIHGFFAMDMLFDEGGEAVRHAGQALARALGVAAPAGEAL